MPATHRRIRPVVEILDARLALSTVPAAPTHLIPGEYPGANTDRPFTPADLATYASAYETYQGEATFLPQYDFNGTGFLGQNDATPILRGLAAITPKIPLKVELALAPGEQVQGHHPATSGGVTHDAVVTIVGKTTPNSIVFVDGTTGAAHNSTIGLFKFDSAAVATDAQGKFTFTVTLPPDAHSGSLGITSFLIRTPFNQQIIRTFPVLRIK